MVHLNPLRTFGVPGFRARTADAVGLSSWPSPFRPGPTTTPDADLAWRDRRGGESSSAAHDPRDGTCHTEHHQAGQHRSPREAVHPHEHTEREQCDAKRQPHRDEHREQHPLVHAVSVDRRVDQWRSRSAADHPPPTAAPRTRRHGPPCSPPTDPVTRAASAATPCGHQPRHSTPTTTQPTRIDTED